jgi:hypothetical protein
MALPFSRLLRSATAVTWSNDDGAPHALAFADGRTPSDLLLPGQQYSRAFDAAGVHDDACSVHPCRSGCGVVRAPSGAPAQREALAPGRRRQATQAASVRQKPGLSPLRRGRRFR